MRKKLYNILIIGTMILSGCDYMDELPADWHTPDLVFQFENTYERNINQSYSYILNGYNRIDGAFLDAATDDGISTMQTSDINKLARGFITAATPVENCWNNHYQGIRQTLFTEKYLNEVPLFLQNRTEHDIDSIKQKGIAQVQTLRAWYEFDLLRHYGGFPIIDSLMNIDNPAFTTLKRSSFEDCVNHIVALCDKAAPKLVVKEADFGRVEKGTALAIKAYTLAYAASALYNQAENTNSVSGYVNADDADIRLRWEKAAVACAEVIGLKNGSADRYALESDYARMFNKCPNNEYIFFHASAKSNDLENRQYPVTISRNLGGGTVPTQQFVDAFCNADGSTYTRASGDVPAYTERDKRFDLIVGYNGSTYGTRGKIYTQLGTGSTNDGLNKVKDFSTNTGYYLKKFMDTGINFANASPGNTFHLFPLIRLAGIYLIYAEAMTQAYGFESMPAGFDITAKQAVQLVRKRAGFNETTDKYFDDMPAGKEGALQKIYDERRIELCFEESRYYDLRRWMKTETLSQAVTGMRIDNEEGTLSYTEIVVDNQRAFETKMYFCPIPRSELRAFPQLDQNPGWDK